MFLPLRIITFTRYDANGNQLQQIVYDYVCELTIKKSYLTLTDTANIKFPRKLLYKSGSGLTPSNAATSQDYINLPAIGDTQNVNYISSQDASALFRRGDSVTIQIGYYPNMQTRFVGYISKIISDLPFQIQCEDSMWILKQSNCIYPDPSQWQSKVKSKHTYISTSVNSTLKMVIDGMLKYVPTKINYDLVDATMDLGHLIIDNVSCAAVLGILKDRYGLYSYFRDDGILYVGFGNNYANTAIQTLQMDGNSGVVINNNTLQWTNSQDVLVKVRGKSINTQTNKVRIYEAYLLNNVLVGKFIDSPAQEDKKFGGDTIEQITINQSDAGLKKWVDNMLPTLNYTGWRGTVETIGEPVINHGDIINLVSNKMPERNGQYLVKSVEISEGVGGYFQKIELGISLKKNVA